jgi:hypothetical protein
MQVGTSAMLSVLYVANESVLLKPSHQVPFQLIKYKLKLGVDKETAKHAHTQHGSFIHLYFEEKKTEILSNNGG